MRAAREPIETIAVNVMGTANLLHALRESVDLQAVLVVTTDKVYRNDEDKIAFSEADRLGGHEPYSASKAAADLLTSAFAESYFEPNSIAVATARGGNVLGGGDFAEDRLVPDIVRAVLAGNAVVLRHPQATRPWQYVLDCLAGYFCYTQALVLRRDMSRALNFGPVRQREQTLPKSRSRSSQWRTPTGFAPPNQPRDLPVARRNACPPTLDRAIPALR